MLDRGLVTRVVIQGQQQQEQQEQEQAQAQAQEHEYEHEQQAEEEQVPDQTPSLPNRSLESEHRSTIEGASDDATAAAATAQDSGRRNHEASANTGRPHPDPPGDDDDATAAQAERAQNVVYYVRSAATSTSSARRAGRIRSAGLESKSYEVRLRAWNCSCPAFTFSAFGTAAAPSLSSARGGAGEVDGDEGGVERVDGRGWVEDRWGGEGEIGGGEKGGDWVFGGLSSLWAVGEEVGPVCKHLLACVVGERCGLLSGFVAERVVGRGEGAGLGAGWDG